MTPFIHPNTPPRLVKRFKECEYKFKVLADEIEINMSYVYNLIAKGTEPTDRTEKGRAARVALFLPRHKRKQYKPRAPTAPMQTKIIGMAKETRNALRYKPRSRRNADRADV